MASFEFLAIVVSIIGLAASITYYAIVIKNQTETRRANILMNLHSEWGKDEYQKASWTVMGLKYDSYHDFVNKYGSTMEYSELNHEIYKVGWFMNGLGSLVHKEYASIGLVDELFGYIVIWLWEILRPIIIESRKRYARAHLKIWLISVILFL